MQSRYKSEMGADLHMEKRQAQVSFWTGLAGRLTRLAILLVFPVLVLLIVETIHRGSLAAALAWTGQYRVEFGISVFAVLCLVLLFTALSRRINAACFMVLSLSLFISVAGTIKMRYLGEPLLPWDIYLVKEAANIALHFPDIFSIKVLGPLLSYLAAGIIFVRKYPGLISVSGGGWRRRAAALALSVVLLFPVCVDQPLPFKASLGVQNISWDQRDNSAANGVLLAYLMNLQWLFVEQPGNYSEKSIATLIDSVARRTNIDESRKPHLIMVMSESFWDPCLLEGVKFSEDPLPFFRALAEEHTAGTLLVPVFGGATVNTEYEVLTGNSMHFLPNGAIAYAQYVRKPQDSLASLLAGQGYRTLAIHSYHAWFYRRNEVYRNLGFSRFISVEQFPDPQMKGDYIADSEIARVIIDEAEKSSEPLFVFAVTMQNHGPYLPQEEKTATIAVEGELAVKSKQTLSAYAEGLRDADASLRQLVGYFEKKKEPAVIVFFGDHLPLLGDDFQIYKETGFFKDDNSYADYLQMHSMPVVIWSNYLAKQEGFFFNTSYFGPYLLNLMEKRGSVYTDYLFTLMQSLPLIPDKPHDKEVSIQQESLAAYTMLQYDLNMGEGYVHKIEQP